MRAPLSPVETRAVIETFLATARRPALIEPGEPLLVLEPGSYTLEDGPAFLTLQAWDEQRNLVRKVQEVEHVERGKLRLSVRRFAGKPGQLHLIDLAHPRKPEWERRGSRLVFRERFRRMLSREFPGWRIAELSSEPDLRHSLSPAYPRGLLIRGTAAIATIAAPPEAADFPAMLSFGLIWLDHARAKNPKLSVDALSSRAPSTVASTLSFYLPLFDPAKGGFSMFSYSDEGYAALLDPRNYGNVATELDRCHPSAEMPFSIEHSEAVALANGSVSLRVAGLEFARLTHGKIFAAGSLISPSEARAVAADLHALRSPEAEHSTLIYQQNPEAWLESAVRSHLATVDASLVSRPLYGQVPAIAGQVRTVMDLLAVDYTGRLAVLELKAAPDIHLPLQALDYWLRVRWHLDHGDFERFGYFPGVALRSAAPRLLLVAPALEFHPSTETILRYLHREIEITRIGLSADWRDQPRILFRLQGAERPHA